MLDTLRPGLKHEQRLFVDAGLTVPSLAQAFAGFADMPPVFATAFMVGFIEWACIEALKPFLEAHERTVGTHIDVGHVAATPVGLEVVAAVELIEVRGRRLRFEVACRDGVEAIGAGFHERAIVDCRRFLNQVEAKARRHV